MNQEVTRRDFIKTAAVAGATLSSVNIVHAQTKQPMIAVLIGCGGRGSGAAKNFLDACKTAGVDGKIVAVADIFPEKAKTAAQRLSVAEANCFSGFDAYLKAINVPGVNYVITATPPGFRAAIVKAAVEAGKNVFMEKPVAVDGAGCRVMYAAGELAKQKGLKIAAGTQRRHQAGYLDTIKRIQDGAIGDVVALRAYWVNGGPIWHRGDQGATELEKQVRNWYHYIWLCGDHICEQHVHNLDVCNWIMNAHPVKAWGMGARMQLDDPRFGGPKSGEIWDEFAIEYEYENGVRMSSYCSQIKRSWSSVSEAVVGAKGTSNPSSTIDVKGEKTWRTQAKGINPYEQEHVDLINAIINNTELNEAKNVTDSTLTAILGREAAYSGGLVKWDDVLNARFQYGPEQIYSDCSKMTWGPFRTLKPPMPSKHDILKDTPIIDVV